MKSRERERLPATVHDTVLVATQNASELESLGAWAKAVGLELKVGSALAGPALPANDSQVLIQIVEWPSGPVSRDLISALQTSNPGATLLIIPEGGEADFAASEIPDDWDFVRRPCDCRELIWRAERALSRLMRRESGVIKVQELVCGPLCHDPATGEISAQGRVLNLLRRAERDVLLYLMRNSRRFTSAEELQREVLHSHGSGGAARNQIYELRRKLDAVGLKGAILSKGCQGYRLRW